MAAPAKSYGGIGGPEPAASAGGKGGAFVRVQSVFRNWVYPNTPEHQDKQFLAEAGRYHLYISYACPWASRALAFLYLKGLEKAIGLSVVHPVMRRTRPDNPEDSHIGWTFTTETLAGANGHGQFTGEGVIPDDVNNATFIRDLYEMSANAPAELGRFTVPVLWCKKNKCIVNNESSEIIQIFNSAFNAVAEKPELDLFPADLKDEQGAMNDWVYGTINNGVYKCGFATGQEAYDEAVEALFTALDRVEEILTERRFLCGPRMTAADVRLFVTLVRFDEVYVQHFKCCKYFIREKPALLGWLREMYQIPEIRRSVNMKHIKEHYIGSHGQINTFSIVPVGQGLAVLEQPANRDHLPKD